MPLCAWDEFGHMVIAQIALECLSKEQQQKVIELSSSIKNEYTPEESSFVQSVTWPDTIRFNETPGWQFYYHFRDTPFDPQNVITQNKKEEIKGELQHDSVVFAVDQFMQAFTKKGNKSILEQIIALRMIAHYVGDLHQPLHAIDRYSKKNPNGDEGGNLYDIIFEDKKTNLHEIWDNCLGQFKKVQVPPSLEDLEYINKTAENLLFEYHEIKENGPIDIEEWTNQSYTYAKNEVYQAERDKPITKEYYEKNKIHVQKLLVTAGKRLTLILNKIFPKGLSEN